MALTRANLRLDLAYKWGETLELVADSGSTTTLVDAAALSQPNDFWNKALLYIITDVGGAGAAPEGESRTVSDYDLATTKLTVSPAFSAAVGAGDTAMVSHLKGVTIGQIHHQLNRAIGDASKWYYLRKTDESTVTDALAVGTYDYALPTDLLVLNRIRVRDDTDCPWIEMDKGFSIYPKTVSSVIRPYIDFKSFDTNWTVQLQYTANLSSLTTDASVVGIEPVYEESCRQYITSRTNQYLHQMMASGNEANIRYHITMRDIFRDEADKMALLNPMPQLETVYPRSLWMTLQPRKAYLTTEEISDGVRS